MSQSSTSNLNLQRWIALASIFLMVGKFYAYYLTNSVSILTDALESIVNVVAGLIGVYSLYVSSKPRDADHPYGHGKAEFISAAVEGTMVLSAGLVIIYTAVKHLLYPVVLQELQIGIYLIGFSAAINFVLGQIALRRGKNTASPALIASGQHLLTDTWSTLGIISGILIIRVTGLIWLDSVVAMFFGGFIIYTGYAIVTNSLAGIMDKADEALLKQMIQLLHVQRRKNWVDLHNLRVIKYGNVLHVDGHLTVPWYLTINQAHDEIDILAKQIRTKFGESLELFIHSDGCMYYQCHICIKDDCPVRQHNFKGSVEWNIDNALQNEKHSLKDLADENNNNLENRR